MGINRDGFLALPDYRENLICELLMGHPSGLTIPDTSGNGNDGTKTSQVERLQGSKNKVLNFDPAGAEVTIPYSDNMALQVGTHSYVFWMKYVDPIIDKVVLFEKDDVGSNAFFFAPYLTDPR